MPRFCQKCASKLAPKFVDDDRRERLVCDACGFVHYLNPRVVSNVLPERDRRILLLRRGIDPAHGLWTFPGGYLELGETAEEGAAREAREEVGAEVMLGDLLGVYTGLEAGNVVVVFRSREVSGDPSPGPEILEVRWFAPEEIPWSELAFETTRQALRDWAALNARPRPP